MTARARVLLLCVLVVGIACTPSTEAPSSASRDAAADSIASAAPGTDIYLAALERTEAGALQVGAPTNVTRRSGYDNQPTFVREGGALLYTAVQEAQTDVFRYSINGDSTTRITTTSVSEYSPTPRPDGAMTLVRVEVDGRQRLWTYTGQGRPEAPVFSDLPRVGYHAWANPEQVLLFVLGDPPSLQQALVETRVRDTVATRIGRSLQPVPGRPAVSFVQVAEDSTTTLHVFDARTGGVQRIGGTPGSGRSVDHAWTPDGTLLLADSTFVYARSPEAEQWSRVGDLAPLEPSRLAVSPDGGTLALVAADS
jgi:Tol biopolymer transport system component